MSVAKEVKQTVTWAKSRGWSVCRRRKNHLCFRRPGHRTIFTSSTPSEPRALKNFKAELKRAEREYENELERT